MKTFAFAVAAGLVAFGTTPAFAATKFANGNYAVSGTAICQAITGPVGQSDGAFQQVAGKISLTATATGATGSFIKGFAFTGPLATAKGSVAVEVTNNSPVVLTMTGTGNPYAMTLKIGSTSSTGQLVFGEASGGVARQAGLIMRFANEDGVTNNCSMQLQLVHE